MIKSKLIDMNPHIAIIIPMKRRLLETQDLYQSRSNYTSLLGVAQSVRDVPVKFASNAVHTLVCRNLVEKYFRRVPYWFSTEGKKVANAMVQVLSYRDMLVYSRLEDKFSKYKTNGFE